MASPVLADLPDASDIALADLAGLDALGWVDSVQGVRLDLATVLMMAVCLWVWASGEEEGHERKRNKAEEVEVEAQSFAPSSCN